MYRRSRVKQVRDLVCLLYHWRTGRRPHWWRGWHWR